MIQCKERKNLIKFILNFYSFIVFGRVNELKSEIDVSDDIVMKFKQFWAHFKGSPLKGGILIHTSSIACIS